MSTITTLVNISPMIRQSFDPHLLMTFLERSYKNNETKLKRRALKKIRAIDIGKKRDFEILLKKYESLYERKKDEEKRYLEKIKNSGEVPCIPNEGGTVRFRRYKDPKFIK